MMVNKICKSVKIDEVITKFPGAFFVTWCRLLTARCFWATNNEQSRAAALMSVIMTDMQQNGLFTTTLSIVGHEFL